MDPTPWDALAAAFAPTDLTWRVVKLSPDKLSAQVRPQLPVAAVTARLDAVLGVGGWSHSFVSLGERGLSCTLTVSAPGAEVQKAAVAAYGLLTAGQVAQAVTEAAEDALVAAAGFFGLRPAVTVEELPWVDYDPEQGQILYEPDLTAAELELSAAGLPEVASASFPSSPPPSFQPASEPTSEPSSPPPSEAPKSAGQQAIDKLVDRLKADGRGLQAARLLNTYGGYGSDPQAARELYAKLRELLLESPSS